MKNSPIPVFRRSTEKGRGSRRGDATTVGPLRGTEGSNPFLSSAESAANLTSSIRAPIEEPVSTPSRRFAHHPGGRPGGRVRLRAPSGIGSYKPSPAGTSTLARMAPSKCRRRTPNIGSVMAGPNSQDGRATKRLDPQMSAHTSSAMRPASRPTRAGSKFTVPWKRLGLRISSPVAGSLAPPVRDRSYVEGWKISPNHCLNQELART